MTPLKDRTAIAGIGQTEFGKGLEQTELALACTSIKAALDDAGIKASEVDGLVSYTMQGAEEDEVAATLGFNDLTFFSRLPAGGGGSAGTVCHATLGIATGQADVVVAYRSRKRSGRASRPWAQQAEDRMVHPRAMWTRPWGIVRPVDELALLTRRYMLEYGATREHLANVALTFRAHANRNPSAFMHARPLTREEYFGARWVSDPLCLFDCCLETDGAMAVVVVSAERARDLRQVPAYIHAVAQGLTSDSVMMSNFFGDDPLQTQANACAKSLWRQSDIQPADIDVAQIYDAFSPEIFFCLEAYRFCKRGEGAAFTENGNITLGGKLPLNTSGGGLSEVYLHGYNMIIEGVRQMRGTSTAQVPDAETCFVCASDLNPTGAFVLRRQ
jgi:acetyl-CoA acetyltransferase